MGKSENHVYNIDLQISNSQSSKAALKYMQDAFDASEQSMDALNKSYDELANNTKDTTELQKQYNKIIEKSLKDKDSMIDKLNAEKIVLMQNADLTEDQKTKQIKIINAKIKSIKLEQQLIKSKTNEFNTEKKLNSLIKDDLNALSAKVKEQLKFVAALKTTEGRYNAIKKAATGIAKTGAKVGTKALKVGAVGAAGILGLIGGAALGSVGSIEAKERALGSLKSGIDPSVVDRVYISSGGDWESIVAAVNNLSNITKDNGLLVQGAVLELQNPGVGKMLLSTSKQNEGNITQLNNIITQIRKQTGAQDMTAAIEASTRSMAVSKTRISQAEYLQAYAALSQAGLEEETINRIINSVSKQKGNFITNLNNAKLDQYVYGQEKIRMQNTKLNLSALDADKRPGKSNAQKIAEKMRAVELKKNKIIADFIEKIDVDAFSRLFSLLFNLAGSILPKALNTIIPIMNKIAKFLGDVVDAFSRSKSVGDFFKEMHKILNPAVRLNAELTKELKEESAKKDDLLKRIDNAESRNRALTVAAMQELKGKYYSPAPSNISHASGYSSMSHYAQGGIATSPSICGEAGPELIIPLDYSRAGRANQIINNFNTTQSFNMQSNQTTPLAFSQVIGQNRFIRRFVGAH